MLNEMDHDLPTYLSRESKQARSDDEEFSAIGLYQVEIRRRLRDESSLSAEEILDLEREARDLYLGYKAKEAVIYKRVMKAEVAAHLAKTKTLPAERQKILAQVDEVNISDQVDALS